MTDRKQSAILYQRYTKLYLTNSIAHKKCNSQYEVRYIVAKDSDTLLNSLPDRQILFSMVAALVCT